MWRPKQTWYRNGWYAICFVFCLTKRSDFNIVLFSTRLLCLGLRNYLREPLKPAEATPCVWPDTSHLAFLGCRKQEQGSYNIITITSPGALLICQQISNDNTNLTGRRISVFNAQDKPIQNEAGLNILFGDYPKRRGLMVSGLSSQLPSCETNFIHIYW